MYHARVKQFIRLGVAEAVVQRCSIKKVFLEIRPATLLKKRLWHKCFPVNFAKFLRTPFFIEQPWWLLLELQIVTFSVLHLSGNFYTGLYFKSFRYFWNLVDTFDFMEGYL